LCFLKDIAAEATLDLRFRNFVVAFRMTNNFFIDHASRDCPDFDTVSLVKELRVITIPPRSQSKGLNDQAILAHVLLGIAASSLIGA
jgi:hypothetical protein